MKARQLWREHSLPVVAAGWQREAGIPKLFLSPLQWGWCGSEGGMSGKHAHREAVAAEALLVVTLKKKSILTAAILCLRENFSFDFSGS